jgi:hypothetical protein
MYYVGFRTKFQLQAVDGALASYTQRGFMQGNPHDYWLLLVESRMNGTACGV